MPGDYEAVKKILESNNITCIDDLEYGGMCFDELLDYFEDEMPYGVLKARTGMPDDVDYGVWSEFAVKGLREDAEVDVAINLEAESKRGK